MGVGRAEEGGQFGAERMALGEGPRAGRERRGEREAIDVGEIGRVEEFAEQGDVERAGRAGAEGVEVRQASEQKADEAEFIMLKDGRVHFEGNSRELRATRDEYVSTFLS